jgi:hypothetical protein
MQILIPLGFNLGIFLLLHFVIGKYAPRLPASKDSKREILEALGLWLLVAIAVTVALTLVPESELADPSFQTVLLINLALLPFWILIPLPGSDSGQTREGTGSKQSLVLFGNPLRIDACQR